MIDPGSRSGFAPRAAWYSPCALPCCYNPCCGWRQGGLRRVHGALTGRRISESVFSCGGSDGMLLLNSTAGSTAGWRAGALLRHVCGALLAAVLCFGWGQGRAAAPQAPDEAPPRSGDLVLPAGAAAQPGSKRRCVPVCRKWGQSCSSTLTRQDANCRRVCRHVAQECYDTVDE